MILYTSTFISTVWDEKDEKSFCSLNPFQREECLKYRKIEDRKSYLYARMLLKKYLPEYTRIPYDQISFQKGRYGKPNIATEGVQVYFNLSHTTGMAALAVSTIRPVGVDVELIKNIPDQAYRIMDICFHPEEKGYVLHKNSGVVSNEDFFYIWTRKEAFIKKLGIGMSCNMKSINTLSEENSLMIHSISINGYALAICE